MVSTPPPTEVDGMVSESVGRPGRTHRCAPTRAGRGRIGLLLDLRGGRMAMRPYMTARAGRTSAKPATLKSAGLLFVLDLAMQSPLAERLAPRGGSDQGSAASRQRVSSAATSNGKSWPWRRWRERGLKPGANVAGAVRSLDLAAIQHFATVVVEHLHGNLSCFRRSKWVAASRTAPTHETLGPHHPNASDQTTSEKSTTSTLWSSLMSE